MSYTRIFISFQLPLFIIAAFISLSTISCSKTPDVRLTMCQDLAMLLLNSPESLEWIDHKSLMNGHDDLEMQVAYSITESNGQILNVQASCFYHYDQDEIGAETFNTPTAAYSTYPNKMILKGKEIDQKQLINTINRVMVHQGKKAIIKAKEGVDIAKEKAEEGIEKINQEVKKQLEK